MTDKYRDEVEIANLSGGGFRVECRKNDSRETHYCEWVEINGNAFSTGTSATLSGAIATEYVPGDEQNPSGVQLEV